jgi:hypothetical protein
MLAPMEGSDSVFIFLPLIVFSLSWLRKFSARKAAAAEAVQVQASPAFAEDPEIDALRARHEVRELINAEEGFGLQQLPSGVYGFTCAPCQWDSPLFRKKTTQGFEVHKLPDGTPMLVGFVSPEDFRKMESAEGPITIHLFPDRRDEANTLVSISLSRVHRHKEHSQRAGTGLQLDLESE